MITVLAGGLGAARFLRGLVRAVPATEVTVIGNTGDDIDIYGVHVCPDLDIVTFMLAEILDEERQFGIRGDSHRVMEELRATGTDTWFGLGDADLGVCLARTLMLAQGASLSQATAALTARFGLELRMLPMTDAPVHTSIDTPQGPMHFQEYWVRHRASIPAIGVRLVGAETASPAPGVLEAIETASTVIVAPSNPVVSIGTILSIPGIRDALVATAAPVVGVSPIVGGAPVRGMADKLMPAVGAEVSALGVARLYTDFLDGFVIDDADASLASSIASLGITVDVQQTLMRAPEDAAVLAKAVVALAEALRA